MQKSEVWTVNLLPEDLEIFERHSNERRSDSNKSGWVDKAKKTDGSDSVVGYAGEFVVSLALNLPINNHSVKHYKNLNDPDLGTNIEVKTRREADPRRWDLAVNDYNLKDDRIYFLVLGHLYPKEMKIAGWAYGHEVRSDGRLFKHSSSGHCFFVYDYKKLKPVRAYFDLGLHRPGSSTVELRI